VLQQRNSLLRSFARDRVAPNSNKAAHELEFWNSELTATAVDVLALRIGAIGSIGERARRHFELLTGVASLAVSYSAPRVPLPTPSMVGDEWRAPAQSFRQALSAAFAASLEAAQGEELRRGVTAIGPHRDDFVVTADAIDLGRYGSRGQQRLAVIAIKLAELDFLEDAAGEPPVLLLDDFLSELDASHRRKTVDVLASREAQMCVTATDASDLDAPELARLPLLHTVAGAIEQIDCC
jgi:DNA replication and repair protein RecF